MVHPLLKSRFIIFTWLGVWTFIMIVQFLTLYFSAGYSFSFSLADSLISGITYIFISLGLWFAIRFGIHKKRKPLSLILNNLLLYVATATIWTGTSITFISIINYEFGLLYTETILLYRIPASLLFYISTVVIYYAISFYETLQIKQAQEMQLKTLVREAQLNELRSQLHPHFLFNSLNSINSLTISNPQKAGEMLIKLSEFLRYSLSRKGHSMATFEKELHHIRLYLDIEKVRFGKRLDFICEVENIPENWPLPLMLLQPLIENCVKHGVYHSTETITIHLKAEVSNNVLTITITNNFDPEAITVKGTGTGLINVRDRLRLVYGTTSHLETQQTENTFTVLIHIPSTVQN